MKIRQGDVLLQTIDKLPEGVRPVKDKILAYGEVTGHTHRFVESDNVNRYEDGNGHIYVEVLRPTVLTHEEHNQWQKYTDMGYVPYGGMILPGVYEQIQERSYDYVDEEAKKTID